MPDWKEFERMVFGRSSAPSGGTVPPPVASLSPFRQSMAWIKSALGLQAGSPPQDLNVAQILPYLDAFQNGWPFANYVSTANAGAALIGPIGVFTSNAIVFADNRFIQRLMAYEITHSGGAAPITAIFRVGAIPPAGVRAAIAQVVLAPGGGKATMVDIFGARDIIVPPGMSLTVDGGGAALLAGESISFNGGLIQQIPAGFHL